MRVPTYRKHKATGGAWIEANGRLIYLGTYGTDQAREKYFHELAKWAETKGSRAAITAYLTELARWADERGTPEARKKFQDETARCAAGASPRQLPPIAAAAPGEPLLVKQMILDYWQRKVTEHFRKRGKLTSEGKNIRTALKYLRRMYGELPAHAFDLVKLETYRNRLIDEAIRRRGKPIKVKTVRERVRQIREMFRWAVNRKLVPAAVWAELQALEDIDPRRTRAAPNGKVPAVPDELVEMTLPLLTPLAADVVRFIRRTGCRPGEPGALRPCDVVRHPEVDEWYFRPEGHKTEHHGKERRVYIGPKAQEILRPYLERAPDQYCFGHDRLGRPSATGKPYTQPTLARALKRALCKLAESLGHTLPPRPKTKPKQGKKPKAQYAWTPKREWFEAVGAPYWHLHQLRHTAADEIKSSLDLESASAVLGHTDTRTTERYLDERREDQRKFDKAAQVARQIG